MPTNSKIFVLHAFAVIWFMAFMQAKYAQAFVNPLEINAYKFFDSITGESVSLKGLAYYPRPNTGILDVNNFDFFTEEYRPVWEPDVLYFKKLGINALRIYAVDPSLDHSGFMCACAEAGIYVLVGICASCKNCNILPDSAPDCYPAELKVRGEMVISNFIRFDNLLGFDAGNEVDLFTDMQPWKNAPCQKKFIRDMRAYMANCPVRQIPVGLVIADVDRVVKTNYYNCYTTAEQDPYELASWVGLNTYQHCDGSITELADAPAYQSIIADYQNYSIPLILAEYGCVNPSFPTVDGFQSQRTFYDSEWIYQTGMKDTLAGGFIYEYSVEASIAKVPFPFTDYSAGNFGIGYYSPENCDHINVTCTYNPEPEFFNLQKAYAATQTRGEYMNSTFSPSADRLSRTPCPSDYSGIDEFVWAADSQADSGCPWSGSFVCPGAPTPSSAGPSAVSGASIVPTVTWSPTATYYPTTTYIPTASSSASATIFSTKSPNKQQSSKNNTAPSTTPDPKIPTTNSPTDMPFNVTKTTLNDNSPTTSTSGGSSKGCGIQSMLTIFVQMTFLVFIGIRSFT